MNIQFCACFLIAYGLSFIELEVLANDMDTIGPNFRLSYLTRTEKVGIVHVYMCVCVCVRVCDSFVRAYVGMYTVPVEHLKIVVQKFYAPDCIPSHYHTV